jgi:single-stranded-DNA-specific exonuclease
VAARLAQEFGKPVVLLRAPPGEPARGSARTVEGVDIGAVVAACAPLLQVWGGHRGAAGLTLAPEIIPALRAELSRQVALHRSASAPVGEDGLTLDAELPLAAVSLALAGRLARLAPFGPGNPPPLFLLRGLEVISDRRIGREGTHRRLVVQDAQGETRTALWFRNADTELPPGPIDLAAQAVRNEQRGVAGVELHIQAVRPAELERALAAARPVPRVVDLRGKLLTVDSLPPQAEEGEAVWYAEGTLLGERAAFAPRQALRPARTLVLWNIPPARALLDWLLLAANPGEVIVCGRITTDDSLEGVVRSTAGMCRYALGRDGLAHLGRMAARLGTTEAVVRAALLALEADGLVQLAEWLEGDLLRLAEGGAPADPYTRSERAASLRTLLAEVRAYRRFFQRAHLDALGLAPPPAR